MALTEIRDIMVMGIAGVGVYLFYRFITKDNPDSAGTQNNNYYVPSPDSVDPNHPFSGTVLDAVYDAGWDYMGDMRGTTNDYFNMVGLDYWFSWMKGGAL